MEDFTFSFLELAPNNRCRWRRLDSPKGKPRTLLTFKGSCSDSEVAWSQDGLAGAVLTGTRKGSQSAWSVDLVTGRGRSIPLPKRGPVTHLGFDAAGDLLAHAFLWKKGTWTLLETQETYSGYGEGYPEEPLAAFQRLGERSNQLSRHHVDWSGIPTDSKSAVALLVCDAWTVAPWPSALLTEGRRRMQ